MGDILRDLNPFHSPEEVSSVKDIKNISIVTVEPDVTDRLLGVDMETFLHEVSLCHRMIEEYENNLQHIERLQTNIWKGLRWGLEQRKKMSADIEEKCARNKQIHTEVRKAIKSGYNSVKFKSEQEESIRKQQVSSLTEKIKECLKKSLELDTSYEKMAKQKLVNEIKILGIKGMSEEEIEHKVSSNDLESITAQRGIAGDIKEAEKHLAEITERNDGIQKLAEDISDLSSCFREMSDLVQEQGIVIDVVDTKVETSRAEVKMGVQALAFVRSYRDKLFENKRRLLFILAGILTFFLVIIIVAAITGDPEYAGYDSCDPNTDPYCIG